MSKTNSAKVMKCFRLSASMGEMLADAAAHAGVDEAVLFDAALEQFILSAAPESVRVEAERRAKLVGRELTKMRRNSEGEGKTAPKSRRIPADVALALERATKDQAYCEADLVESALNQCLILVTTELVRKREIFQALSTAKALAAQLQSAGVKTGRELGRLRRKDKSRARV